MKRRGREKEGVPVKRERKLKNSEFLVIGLLIISQTAALLLHHRTS
jgi:hypothetical protein